MILGWTGCSVLPCSGRRDNRKINKCSVLTEVRLDTWRLIFVCTALKYIHIHGQEGRVIIGRVGGGGGGLRGSVVKCLTRYPGVLGSNRTGSFGFFVRVSLGKTLQSPSLVLVKPRKEMNNVCCRRDSTEIPSKVA